MYTIRFAACVIAAQGCSFTACHGQNQQEKLRDLIQQHENLQRRRLRVIAEIGEFGLEGRAAAPQLLRWLDDDSVSDTVAKALAAMGPEISTDLAVELRSDSVDRVLKVLDVVEQMGADGARVALTVIGLLDSESPKIRGRVVKLLERSRLLPEKAVPALAKLVEQDDAVLAEDAATALGEYETAADSSFEALARLYARPDWQETNSYYPRRMALLAMPRIRPDSPEVLEILTGALLEEDLRQVNFRYSWAVYAMQALSRTTIDISACEPNLLRLMETADIRSDPWKYGLATRLLARIHSSEGERLVREDMDRPLGENVDDWFIYDDIPLVYESTLVRVMAASAVSAIDPDDAQARDVLGEIARDRQWLPLEDQGFKGSDPISPLIEAIRALTRLDDLDQKVVSEIIALPLGEGRTRLSDVVWWFRVRHDPGFLDEADHLTEVPLRRGFESWVTADELAAWLGDKLEAVAPQLIDDFLQESGAADHDSYQDAKSRLMALGEAGVRATFRRGFQLLDNPDQIARVFFVGTNSAIREELLRLAGEFQVDFDTLASELKPERDFESRAFTMRLLGETRCQDPRAIAALTAGLKDTHPLVRFRAAQALGQLGVAAADSEELLRLALNDDFQCVRSAAAISQRQIRSGARK